MLSINLPRIEWLSKTNLNAQYHHSIVISLLRGLAAVEVVAAHLRAQLYPSLKSLPDPSLAYQALSFFTGFAHQAVVIFFLLSGWLVGGSLLNKLSEPLAMLSYSIDRVTRLWIVLVPAFLLTLLFGILEGVVDPRRFDFSSDEPYSVTVFGGNMLGVQDMAVPRYGGNFALWSLAYETWYYILFPFVVLSFAASSRICRTGALAVALLIGAGLSTAVTLYFGLWLMGVAFSRVRIVATRHMLALLCALLGGVSVFFRLTGSNDILVEASFIQDLVFSLAFLLVLCSLQTPAKLGDPATRIAARVGTILAAFSFTLYVIHVPLLLMMRTLLAPFMPDGRLDPANPLHFLVYAGMLAGIMLLAWLFHLPFEAQTVRLRRWIKRLLWRAPPAAVQNIA